MYAQVIRRGLAFMAFTARLGHVGAVYSRVRVLSRQVRGHVAVPRVTVRAAGSAAMDALVERFMSIVMEQLTTEVWQRFAGAVTACAIEVYESWEIARLLVRGHVRRRLVLCTDQLSTI